MKNTIPNEINLPNQFNTKSIVKGKDYLIKFLQWRKLRSMNKSRRLSRMNNLINGRTKIINTKRQLILITLANHYETLKLKIKLMKFLKQVLKTCNNKINSGKWKKWNRHSIWRTLNNTKKHKKLSKTNNLINRQANPEN